MPDRDIPAHRLHHAVRIGSYGLGTIAAWTGITLLIQERARMSTPGWQVAFTFLSPTFWGCCLAFGGAAMLGALLFGGRGRKLLGAASIAVAVVMTVRVVAAVVALRDPSASGTAPPIFAVAAGAYLVHGLVHFDWVDKLR